MSFIWGYIYTLRGDDGSHIFLSIQYQDYEDDQVEGEDKKLNSAYGVDPLFDKFS